MNIFLDEVVINVFGGDGGSGAVSFRTARFRPKGGPDGGDGARGGDVVLVAQDHTRCLFEVSKSENYRGDAGENGRGTLKKGSRGKDCVIYVPIGTLIKVARTGELLADLDHDGKSFIAAYGGDGGRGNKFYTCSTDQAPHHADKGEPGETRKLHLEVKLIADVGLVGFPNAGKSTLLGNTSGANPKTAPYPFTTINPHLGVVEITPDKKFIMADIPGIIEGAHHGKGMGIDFLKHVERTRILLHLVDPLLDSFETLLKNVHTINNELQSFSKTLANKPQIVVITKIDSLDQETTDDLVKKLSEAVDYPVLAISSLARKGIDGLFRELLPLL